MPSVWKVLQPTLDTSSSRNTSQSEMKSSEPGMSSLTLPYPSHFVLDVSLSEDTRQYFSSVITSFPSERS